MFILFTSKQIDEFLYQHVSHGNVEKVEGSLFTKKLIESVLPIVC